MKTGRSDGYLIGILKHLYCEKKISLMEFHSTITKLFYVIDDDRMNNDTETRLLRGKERNKQLGY